MKVTVSCEALTRVMLLAVRPEPPVAMVDPAVKLVPVSVTLTEVPLAPLLGFMAVRVGAEGTGFTVNGNVLLLPAAVFTATV